MISKIKFIRSIEFLHTSPEGEVDFEKSKQIPADLANAKRPPADYDVMLDFRRSQLKLSTADVWYLAADLTNHNDTFRDKVAVLALPGLNFDTAEFLELCSKNRGLNVDVFTNYEDAIQWFYENSNSPS